jgi:hypothetical protein
MRRSLWFVLPLLAAIGCTALFAGGNLVHTPAKDPLPARESTMINPASSLPMANTDYDVRGNPYGFAAP